MKISLIATHPIQYQIPWFQNMSKKEDINFKVFFGLLPNKKQQAIGFGGKFSWDISLLEGYSWQVLKNSAKNPGLDSFWGIKSADIYQKLKNWRPDIVILTGWNSYLLIQALIVSKYLKIPVLVRGVSNNLRPCSWKKYLLHRLLFTQYNAFLATGKINIKFYRNYGISPHKLFNVSYFIDNKRFKTVAKKLINSKMGLREKYQIPNKAICFLYTGKLISIKRIMDLLRALKQIKKQVDNVHLLVVGRGELMQQAKQYVTKHHLPVSFAGFINQLDIPEIYVASDCLVLPSYSETWGLVVNEAMASGIPAIVSDKVGCSIDLIEEDITGSIFPMGNIEILAEKMLFYTQRPQQLKAMGKVAQQKVCDNYSVEKTLEGTFQAIKFVL